MDNSIDLYNPCFECNLRYGHGYTEDCDNKCQYAKVVKEKLAKIDLEEMQSLLIVQPERAKDIPKPITIENGFVKCGGCGKYIRLPIADHYSYCPECGQAIKWIGEEE